MIELQNCAFLRLPNTRLVCCTYKSTVCSFSEIRECLKLDPDHKECHPHYKKVKKLVKQMESVSNLIGESKWDECVEKADAMLKTEPKLFVYRHRAHGHKCHCHSKVCISESVRV